MTTPQTALSTSAQAYREKIFTLLGDRNPLDVLARTSTELAAIVAQHPAPFLRFRPFEGKWTPNEIIGHLTDSEWVYGYRLRLILSEDNPTILGTTQESWVAALRHNEREPAELVETFRVLRDLNLAVWKRTTASDLDRAGQHNERGPESLDQMLRLLAGHDLPPERLPGGLVHDALVARDRALAYGVEEEAVSFAGGRDVVGDREAV